MADLVLSQFERGSVSDARTLYAAGNAAAELAGPEYFDRIADIVSRRYPGRERLIDWLAKSRRTDALAIIVDQLDDPQVAPFVMKILRRRKRSLAEGVRLRVRPLLDEYKDYPGDPDLLPGELRKQARLTLEALYPAS
ncbi:hypothetical protein [Tsukamurella strandjordii]|uniref:Uncharacterized protein n=1 Tax=Tsukamurella strandjordii TaxID=147577 RepID=A0AA90ND50_9ACTN|nr:hypothetical protein [Tsukamurella strandjordii]MDP0398217.1 hypothetical protein [Tsukamurella strandjordii]